MDLRVLLRMARLARQRPSRRRAVVVFGAIAAALALAGIEGLGGWPDWLAAERAARSPGLAIRP